MKAHTKKVGKKPKPKQKERRKKKRKRRRQFNRPAPTKCDKTCDLEWNIKYVLKIE